jgi:predicted metal-dependent enzyme (double-stranded beta helix superfamily)
VTIDELRAELRTLCDDTDRWSGLVRHDPGQRVFVELATGNDDVEAWLICWMPGHDTGFHDHDISSGAVTVLAGEVVEDRLSLDGVPPSRRVGPGESFTFSPTDIHRVRHAGDGPAVTLHVYSPPLRRMGTYRQEGGALERHSVGKDVELRAA